MTSAAWGVELERERKGWNRNTDHICKKRPANWWLSIFPTRSEWICPECGGRWYATMATRRIGNWDVETWQWFAKRTPPYI